MLFLAGPAAAQVVERSLPPAASPGAVGVPAPAALPREDDDRPLGATLGCVRLELDVTSAAPCTGVVSDPRLPALDRGARRALAQLLGRPLSRKAIAAVRDVVVSAYRRRHRPFVSVTTPPQEVTGGVLRLRVLEYRRGALTVTGASGPAAAQVRAQVRAVANEAIDAQDLSEDLKWLNRNPSRSVSVVLSPGAAAGAVDLDLRTTSQRPFRVYGGAASSDSPQSGDARLFVGGQLALPRILEGAWASYQFTASPDQADDAASRYRSHAGRLDVLAAPGLLVEVTGDRVESRRSVRDFVTDQMVSEGSLSLRRPFVRTFGFHLPWLATADVVAGLEARHAERQVSFGGVAFERASVDVYQLRAGLEGDWERGAARGGGSLTLHVSPGGLGAANGDAAFSAYAFGRPVSSQYAYVALSAYVRSPPVHGLTYLGELQGQVSTGELPETEKAGLGGAALVRGAVLDDGAFSRQLVLRNTAYGPAWRIGGVNLVPNALLDVGYGSVDTTRSGQVLASFGVGGEASLRNNLLLTATVACAMSRGDYTRPGDCRALARLTASY